MKMTTKKMTSKIIPEVGYHLGVGFLQVCKYLIIGYPPLLLSFKDLQTKMNVE